MAFTEPYDPTAPADTDFAKQGDDRIRELKRALTERLSQVIVGWPDTDPLKIKSSELDVDISNMATITVGLEADKPDPAVETFFYETDTDKLYVNEGGDWVEVAADVTVPLPTAIAAKVYKTANQEIADDVDTIIIWDAEAYDFGGLADLGVNDDRLTIPSGEGGLYHLDIMVVLDPLGLPSGDGGIFQRLRIELSGVEVARKDKVVYLQDSVNRSSSIAISVDLNVAEEQFIEAFIRHDRSATGINVVGDFSRTWMSLRKVGETP